MSNLRLVYSEVKTFLLGKTNKGKNVKKRKQKKTKHAYKVIALCLQRRFWIILQSVI